MPMMSEGCSEALARATSKTSHPLRWRHEAALLIWICHPPAPSVRGSAEQSESFPCARTESRKAGGLKFHVE
jgi:hypothetical protein